MKKRIVITGATGMIGTALSRLASESGHEVLAIVRPSSNNISNIPQNKNIKILQCELSGYKDLRLSDQYDTFFHLAWEATTGLYREDVDIQYENVAYTLDAVRLAHRLGCETFVGVGSQAEYGMCNSKQSPKTPTNPVSGYGIAKYAAGKFSRLLCNQLNIKHCWTRVLSIYGAYDHPNSLIMYCIDMLLKGQTPILTECNQVWDYLHCDDAANALYLIASNGKNNEIYCVGSGVSYPLKDYLEMLKNSIDPNLDLGFGMRGYYINQAMYLCADVTNLTADTGFAPKISFDEGIKKTISWYKGRSRL